MSKFLSKNFTKQTFNIPPPVLTEKNLKSQEGRVFLVTGGYAGVGFELSKILYGAGATVYVAGRSEEKGKKALASIKAANSTSRGQLKFLLLDLNDLSSIKRSAETFLSQADRLDVLVNNAGIMAAPSGTKTKQGHDLQWGTNCFGPHLFTKFLVPILIRTAATAPASSVRVLWASSSGVQVLAPWDGGITYVKGKDEIKILSDQMANYGATKVGNVFSAHILQQQIKNKGVVSISFNPGNLKSELQRHQPALVAKILGALLHPAVFGAYTELWAACSETITLEKEIKYVAPWGEDGDSLIRSDVKKALDDGGAQKFWDLCERETVKFA
jgi:retinol dehydrogenase 12